MWQQTPQSEGGKTTDKHELAKRTITCHQVLEKILDWLEVFFFLFSFFIFSFFQFDHYVDATSTPFIADQEAVS